MAVNVGILAHEETPLFTAYERVKYLVTGKHITKGKQSMQDGMVLDMIAIAKAGKDENGKTIAIPLVEVTELPGGGWDIKFPFGKKSLRKVMWRGPMKDDRGFGYKWDIQLMGPDGNPAVDEQGRPKTKRFALHAEDFTFPGFLNYLEKEGEDLNDLTDSERLAGFDDYLADLYDIGFQIDFNLPVGGEDKPDIGMSSWFFRTVVDAKPKPGETEQKYDKDVKVHKYPPKGKPELGMINGDFKMIDPELAVAIEREYLSQDASNGIPAETDSYSGGGFSAPESNLDDLPF